MTPRNAQGSGLSDAHSRRELAALRQLNVAANTRILELEQDLAGTKQSLSDCEAAELTAVNEDLVTSSLEAQTAAEDCAKELADATRAFAVDALTGLPNRELFLDRFTHAIAIAQRHGNRMGLLFLDLDNFKQINDTLGHAIGDQVLKQAADCLVSIVREADTVSRHGGDEFVILLSDIAHASDALAVADTVRARLAAACAVDGHPVHLSASIGISIFPDDGEDAATLIDRADGAMYGAKHSDAGRGLFLVQDVAGPHADVFHSHGPTAAHDWEIAERATHNAELREANTQLVLAAINAQERYAAAELAHIQQKEFMAVIVHELRNPLTPISIVASMLDKTPADQMPQMQETIERQITHISRLVSDLMDMSRVYTGKLRIVIREIDLVRTVEDALSACRPTIEARQQTLTLRIPPTSLRMHGDPVRLAQILMNLLDNASKYTPTQGRIMLSVMQTDQTVVIEVADSGIGISAEALTHVFDPFVQDQRATDFNADGLGIGLTVVRELVEAHGGTVLASSHGQALGSQFVVTLPLDAPLTDD